MKPLRSVPTPGDDDNARADLAPVESVSEVQAVIAHERVYDPATDPEALLLCALMWSAQTGGVPTEDQRIAVLRIFSVTAELLKLRRRVSGLNTRGVPSNTTEGWSSENVSSTIHPGARSVPRLIDSFPSVLRPRYVYTPFTALAPSCPVRGAGR